MEKRAESVELIPAFVWDCPSCGTENFSRTIVLELSQEEMHELRIIHGVEVYEEGQFLTSPTHVECGHCGEEFHAINYSDGDTDEDDEEEDAYFD